MSVHPTHKTRYSDSSRFDEICVYCGATDDALGMGDGGRGLEQPCPRAPRLSAPPMNGEGI